MPQVIHVLVFEDNLGDFWLVKKALAESPRYEYKLHHCESFEKFKSLDTKDQYEVVLLDLSLPDSIGVDTLTECMALVPDIAVVVLTGQSNHELGEDLIALGAQDYIPKEQLLSIGLHRVINHARERKKLQIDLSARNKALAEFAHMASHDLKGPISRLKLLHQLLVIEEGSKNYAENQSTVL